MTQACATRDVVCCRYAPRDLDRIPKYSLRDTNGLSIEVSPEAVLSIPFSPCAEESRARDARTLAAASIRAIAIDCYRAPQGGDSRLSEGRYQREDAIDATFMSVSARKEWLC